MTIELKENERLDDLQRNGLQIIQKTDGFCFGMDAVLLSGFTQDGQSLLVGINLGSLGTLIASLPASSRFFSPQKRRENIFRHLRSRMRLPGWRSGA